MKPLATLMLLTLLAPLAGAKLPALSDEAKAKAAETAAKTAHGNKVADYQLCQSRQRVADYYRAEARKAGKEAPAPVDTPACADPGPFVYVPAGAASGAATAAAAPASAPAKKS